MHACIHTYIHTHTHTHTHIYIYIGRERERAYTSTLSNQRVRTHARGCIFKYTDITRMYTHIHTHIFMCMYACNTRIKIHAHLLRCWFSDICACILSRWASALLIAYPRTSEPMSMLSYNMTHANTTSAAIMTPTATQHLHVCMLYNEYVAAPACMHVLQEFDSLVHAHVRKGHVMSILPCMRVHVRAYRNPTCCCVCSELSEWLCMCMSQQEFWPWCISVRVTTNRICSWQGYVKSSALFMYESTCACRDHIHDSYSANEIAPFRNVTRTCVIMCMRFIFHDTCMHEVPCECQKKQTNQQVS